MSATFRGSLPSEFISQSSAGPATCRATALAFRRTNRMRLPSRDHCGYLSEYDVSFVIWAGSDEPSLRPVQMRPPWTYANRLPSGDHEGSEAALSESPKV